jgi:hypothetical protein
MPYIECSACRQSNWSSHRQCLRCHAPLPFVAAVSNSFLRSPDRKRYLLFGTGALVLLLVMAGLLMLKLASKKPAAGPYEVYENALRNSREFNVPVVVVASRYTFNNLDEQRFDQEATPAAYLLQSLGLIYIHHGMYSDAPMTKSRDGGYVVDPQTGLVPKHYRHVELELTASGQEQAGNWEAYEKKQLGMVGWKVGIGERQLGRVVQVMPVYDHRPLSEAALVSFTWKWKPNELGQLFDKQSPAYKKIDSPQNFPRDPLEVEVNDSHLFYWGMVEMQRVGQGWELSRLTWIGPQGVILAPDQTEEINRLMRGPR